MKSFCFSDKSGILITISAGFIVSGLEFDWVGLGFIGGFFGFEFFFVFVDLSPQQPLF